MSGGSDKQTTEPPKWAVPYFKDYMKASQNVAALPYQPYTGQSVAQLNPYETAGYNAQAQRAMQGSQVNNAAGSELTKTLSGGYLNSNPYMDSMIDSLSKDVNRNYDMVAARGGSFGNTGVEEQRFRALGDVSANLRGQDYAAERGRMTSSIGLAPSIANQDYVDADRLTGAGAGFRDAEQRNLSDDYSRFLEARNYPREQLGILGQGVGLNFGNTTRGSQSDNSLNTAVGAASAILGGK